MACPACHSGLDPQRQANKGERVAECVNKEKNLKNCSCTYLSCSKRGICCECISSHWRNRELPGCLFPSEAEKTYDRSLEYFIKVWSEKLKEEK